MSEAVLNERRRWAVKMVLGGATIAVSANQCELAERTVWGAVKAYRQGGWQAVKVRHGHRPRGAGRALNSNQEREVQRLIRDHVPDQLKMNYALWTRPAVGELIARRFAIHLAVRAVGEYLKRWGFTPQRPLKKAYEQNPAAVDKWVNEEYPKIAVFYLPSYSPELNPDELLNADLKQRVTKAAPPRTKRALTRTAIGALRSIQKPPDRVENYFGQKHVAYAA